MSNIIAKLTFSEKFEGTDVLTVIDDYRLCLKGTNHIFTLEFSSIFIDSQDVVSVTKRVAKLPRITNEEGQLEDLLQGFNSQPFTSVASCPLTPHRSIYSVLHHRNNLTIMLDGDMGWNKLCNFNDMLEESRSEAANTEVVMLQAGQTDNQVRPMVFESGVSVSAHSWLKDRDKCYFLVTMENSVGVVWSLGLSSMTFHMEVVIHTGIDATRSFLFLSPEQSLCILLGLADGQVIMMRFVASKNGSLVHAGNNILWRESDLMQIEHVLYDSEFDRLLFNKHNYIIYFDNISNNNGGVDNDITAKASIVSLPCKYHISGISTWPQEYIVSTFDGNVFKLSITENNSTTTKHPLDWNEKEWNIVCSCVRAFVLVCVLTPSVYYCNRRNKQPFMVVYSRLTSSSEISDVITHASSFTSLYGLLCCIKNDTNVLTMLSSSLDGGADNDLSCKILRFVYYALYCKKKDSLEAEEIKEKIRAIEMRMTMKRMQMVMSGSLRLPPDMEVSAKEFLSSQEVPSGDCVVCRKGMKRQSYDKVHCVDGHVLPRCTQTLTPLPLKHRVCLQCGAGALYNERTGRPWEVLLTDSCPLCDGFLKPL